MSRTMRRMKVLLAALLVLAAIAPARAASYQSWPIEPPAPARELRAAWIATVGNIDWPSKPGLSIAEQQTELIALLDCAVRLKLNAVIFQVRPGCDALYASRIEPWSEYLTGMMGKAPTPYYDPLAFAIEQAHLRGLELHAWFNPFRALHFSARSPVAPTHVSKTRPGLVRTYGRLLWLDPGEPEAQDFSLAVVLDVVRRYDIDGVHFDDYFYPYKEHDAAGRELEFPDDASWARQGTQSKLSRADWRRENVNHFIRAASQAIRSAKPWVKFGVSPFGIWRPHYPAQVEGLDAYDQIYADSRRWLASGWVDYFAPQLYWPIASPKQSFPALLKWWARQNTRDRLLTPGLDVSRVRGDSKPSETINQIRLTRNQTGAAGEILWSLGAVMRNPALTEALSREAFAPPALVPAAPWLGHNRLLRPVLAGVVKNGVEARFVWSTGGGDPVSRWVVQSRANGQWKMSITPAGTTSAIFKGVPEVLAVRPVDRYGNLGPVASVRKRN